MLTRNKLICSYSAVVYYIPTIRNCIWVKIIFTRSLVCRSLFVLLYLYFWPLCCLFIFDIRLPLWYLQTLLICMVVFKGSQRLCLYICVLAVDLSMKGNNCPIMTLYNMCVLSFPLLYTNYSNLVTILRFSEQGLCYLFCSCI